MQLDAVLSYLDKISRYDARPFTPLFFGGERMGWVNVQWKERLLQHESALFEESYQGLVCRLSGSYRSISHALAQAARRWQQAGWLNGWRNENFTAFRPDGTPFFELERAAFRPLGLTSRAVHVNGLCRLESGEVRMWVGRRSPHKAVDPNRMDNLVGGGVAAGETLDLALEREGWEEAGISRDALQGLKPVSVLLAERPVARGLHREWLHGYDLWLGQEQRPCCQDGEVAEHVLLPLAEVEQLLVDERFMIDAALVVVDCLCRLEYWGARNPEMSTALSRIRYAKQGPLVSSV
ncbi:NUDIX hydrolase family protein [Chromobacterium sp. IIBBL 290-4]|uniref:NUDIX hydrolase n=1 Tax=Chromobacterium sp. IIBBL 290-4 TaxID=2953890 RepID=UPI0020B649D9|nr:NUDIX hydrolase family protein [Chromobacterium sp. IIBBL 290-4]UTH76519.1 DUF4743 domain-containing protein [Chromobacterium sp. IIBBL 290-4]